MELHLHYVNLKKAEKKESLESGTDKSIRVCFCTVWLSQAVPRRADSNTSIKLASILRGIIKKDLESGTT